MAMFVPRIIILLCMLGAGWMYMSERYDLLFDWQQDRCLNTKVFFVDTWDKELDRNHLMVVDFPIDTGPIRKGDLVIKRVVGMPGESMTYNAMTIETDTGFQFSSDIRKGAEHIGFTFPEQSVLTLNDDEYFLAGDLPFSFDSRYWGAINEQHIYGKAYAVF
ncbi:MAG: hypothetical protein CBB95_17490 [Alteromonas sp. TMED35]|nr:MAG: hypothetical protein CBB95_17490 [Alteromonas sp. TMED35]|tara:strand:+ start:662 stop:1147 length:486 start_codon:yes stop_codon:yes gene_type:complete